MNKIKFNNNWLFNLILDLKNTKLKNLFSNILFQILL